MNQQTVLRLYSIRDCKLKNFMAPFFATSDEEAIRIIKEQVNYKASLLSSFPTDYELYFVGTFDSYSGAIDSIDDVNYLVCKLDELKQDDSVKYDELLKEVKSQYSNLTVCLGRFNDVLKDMHTQFDNFMSECKKDVELYVPKKDKKSILEKLF